MKHSAIVGGSSAARVINCPGSVKLSKDIPKRPSSQAANRGTLLHEAIAKHLAGVPKEKLVNVFNYAGITLTDDLWAEKIDVALSYLAEIDPNNEMEFIEEVTVDFGDYLPGVFGSVDLIGRLDKKVIMLDWKFGDGVIVNAENNYQLLFYAAAALRTPKLKWVFEGAEDLELIIVQPPSIRRWSTTFDRVKQFEMELVTALKDAESDNPTLKTGSHCRWCPAKLSCPAMNELVVDKPKALSKDLNPVFIAECLDKLEAIDAWVKELKSMALETLEGGGVIPGYKLVSKRAARSWTDEEGAKNELIKLGLKEEDIIQASLISPAEADKILKKKKLSLPKDIVVAISSGSTVVPESDPRPSLNDVHHKLAEFLNSQLTKG